MSKTVGSRRAEVPQTECNLCGLGEDLVTTQIRCMQSRGFRIADEADRPSGRPPMQSMLLRQTGDMP